MQAEDFLKSHSIAELRTLVTSLANDSTSKQTELQHMVGSKYHDFIQSADLIAAMQEKAELMESTFSGFWKCSQDLVSKTQDLLSRTDTSGIQLTPCIELNVDSGLVWDNLESCNIYGAAKIVAFAKLMTDCKQEAQLGFSDCFPPGKINKFRAESGLFHRKASSAAFLMQTVIDDSYLVLIEGNCSPVEKAKALASVGLLAGLHRGEIMTHYLGSADLLLDACLGPMSTGPIDPAVAASQLVEAASCLQRTLLDVHMLFFRPLEAQGVTAASAAIGSAGVASLLSQGGLVSFYQLLFIQDLSRSLTAAVSASSGNSAVGFDFTKFVNAEQARHPSSETRKIFDRWLADVVKKITSCCVKVLEAMGSATDVARLQQRIWHSSTQLAISPTLAGDTERGDGGGSSSRSDASLDRRGPEQRQQGVDHDHISLPDDTIKALSTGASGGLVLHYAQGDWESACRDLLAAKRRRSSDRSKGGASGPPVATLLWSLAFRAPFMLQVERLLRDCCELALARVRKQLLQFLALEGLDVDDRTFAIKSPSRPRAKGSSGAPGLSSGMFDAALATHSAKTFHRAEAVRALLESEITELLAEIVLPVQEGDPQSAAALSRALYVQCAQLVGQLMVLLRVLTTSLRAALSQAHNRRTARTGTSRDRAEDAAGAADCGPALSGLLLVGRVAWLIKTRGRFLEEALTPAVSLNEMSSRPPMGGAGVPMTGAEEQQQQQAQYQQQQFDLSTEDQLRSAFEIADTDGDGLMTYAEAVEAVQALAVTDSSFYAEGSGAGEAEKDQVCPFLSAELTPSVTFTEFAMLCSHLLTTEACSPLRRLLLSADHIVLACHNEWAARLVDDLSNGLTRRVAAELGAAGPAGGLTVTPSFKHSWCSVTADMTDPDSGTSVQETMDVPSQITHALADFMFNLSHRVTSGVLSVDTVQQLYERPPIITTVGSHGDEADSATLSDAYLSKMIAASNSGVDTAKGKTQAPALVLAGAQTPPSVTRLGSYAGAVAHAHALAQLARVYSELQQACQSLPSAAASTPKSLSQSSPAPCTIEDVSVQVMFDLLVCERVCQRQGDALVSNIRATVKSLLFTWKGNLDPINAELLMPLLESSADAHAAKVGLLVPCFGKAPAVQPLVASLAATSKPMFGVFPSTAAPRFALLPLSFSTQAIAPTGGDKAKGKVAPKDSKEIVAALEAAVGKQPKGAEDLSLAGVGAGLSAGSLGRGLMSGLGTLNNFLGTSASALGGVGVAEGGDK